MPNRMLRDWTDSQKFDGISSDSERLFVRLIMKSDDFGRYYGDTRLIRAHCFPLLDNLRANDLDRWLDDLSHRQLILRYETKGRKYLAIVNYGQRLRNVKAKFPEPEGKAPDWLPLDGDLPQIAVNCPPEVEEKGSRIEVEVEGANARQQPRQLDSIELASMSSDAAIALLQVNYPDIDVWNEFVKLKQRCADKGTKPTWTGFLGWLRKATPVVKLKKGAGQTNGHKPENAHAPISLEEQAAMARELAEMKKQIAA